MTMTRTWECASGATADGAVHVLPVADIREHVESDDCWCEPRIEGETWPFLVIHHSADRREVTEVVNASR